MTAFAALEQSSGSAIMLAFANARLVPQGGAAVAAVLSRPPVDLAMGSGGIAARGALVTCLAAELGPAVQRGTRCTVYYGDQLVQPAGTYKVRDRNDDLEPGTARLDLELASV